MARTRKVWGVFFYGWVDLSNPIKSWVHSGLAKPGKSKQDALRACAAQHDIWGYHYTVIPGTVRPDGSIAWPERWPVP
jgi:hypothetical protein